ncbi:ABC transporter ATP-binding protein [Angelakisella massiliensis]|uniref:ABC transporter ATP-binding protein n=1 Tax=Angelakisella massiliensis TaxID=1871018 RepID=UPI000AC38E8D|nr:ABC transporter ATP-binding protein [Angelakisella massiliensis]
MDKPMVEENKNILEVQDLVVEYHTDNEVVHAVNGISFSLEKGKTLGLVGETGAGKTTLALSIMKLLPKVTGKIAGGSILFNGKDLTNTPENEMRMIRGSLITMIFQDPMTSLNPVLTVGDQIAEVVEQHMKLDKKGVEDRVDEILKLVGIPAERKHEYPHQFSGGMKQRIVIAIALACDPQLLLADEPTTALDVTIQSQILDMMEELKEKLNTTIIFITHDLGVVAEFCDYVAVMYAGEIVEMGTAEDIYESDKRHPYTVGLFQSVPNLEEESDRLKPVDGLMPDPVQLPAGCKFHPRCPHCMDICRTQVPEDKVFGTHRIKCHLDF